MDWTIKCAPKWSGDTEKLFIEAPNPIQDDIKNKIYFPISANPEEWDGETEGAGWENEGVCKSTEVNAWIWSCRQGRKYFYACLNLIWIFDRVNIRVKHIFF